MLPAYSSGHGSMINGQRPFVTAIRTGRAASRSPQISRAGCAQTAMSACAVVARRRCHGGLSRCVTECSSPSGIVGDLLAVGSAPWTVGGVWLGRCPRLRRRSSRPMYRITCPSPTRLHARSQVLTRHRSLMYRITGHYPVAVPGRPWPVVGHRGRQAGVGPSRACGKMRVG